MLHGRRILVPGAQRKCDQAGSLIRGHFPAVVTVMSFSLASGPASGPATRKNTVR